MKRQWAELPLNITNTYSGFYRNHWGFFKQYCRGLICKSACPNIMVHNETETQKWNHTSNAQQWKHTNTFCDCPSSMPRSGATAELHGGLVWLSFNQSLGTECTTEPHHHAEGLQRVCTDTAKSWHLWKWGSLRFTLYLCVGFYAETLKEDEDDNGEERNPKGTSEQDWCCHTAQIQPLSSGCLFQGLTVLGLRCAATLVHPSDGEGGGKLRFKLRVDWMCVFSGMC